MLKAIFEELVLIELFFKKKEKRTTSEFMKEIGSWLYSTSAMQSILKYGDEKARFNDIKSSFDASTIWMMGKPYIFQGININFFFFSR